MGTSMSVIAASGSNYIKIALRSQNPSLFCADDIYNLATVLGVKKKANLYPISKGGKKLFVQIKGS